MSEEKLKAAVPAIKFPPAEFRFRPQLLYPDVDLPQADLERIILELYRNELELPEFNLASVTQALSQEWDPNTQWSFREIRGEPRASAIAVTAPAIPWYSIDRPLHRALWGSNWQRDVAECLIQHGADIDVLNATGRTLLLEAIDNGHPEKVDWLLAHGADPGKASEARAVGNEQWDGGITPLVVAMRQGVDALVPRLAASANGTVADIWKPLDLALLSRQTRILEALDSLGASFSTGPDGGNSGADLQESAKDLLLFFCLSYHDIPPRACKSAFTAVLQTEDFKRSWEASRKTLQYETAIDTFFRLLSGMAKTRNLFEPPQSYCNSCIAFIAAVSRAPKAASAWKSSDELAESVTHSSNLRELQRTAANGCPLCLLFLDAVEDEGGVSESPVEFLLDELLTGVLRMKHGESVVPLTLGFLPEKILYNPLEQVDDAYAGTGSPRAFAVTRAWFNFCKERHHTCTRPQDFSPPVLPSRVLDVTGGDETSPYLRLMETNGQAAQYCALSYCWGQTSNNARTTKDNLEQRLQKIPEDSLPATIHDAVVAARGLGFRYLWVDGLCIVQDDPLDWDREAARMKDVYSNASLTISTLSGEGCTSKLFSPRTARQTNPLPLPFAMPRAAGSPDGWVRAIFPTSAKEPIREAADKLSPVHRRCWTLQEQELSTRILWYGNAHLQWECAMQFASEPSPWLREQTGKKQFVLSKKAQSQGILHNSVLSGEENVPRDYLYRIWEELVADYTTRDITYQSDRITAILGIAGLVAPYIDSTFVAGVWDGPYLLRSLLWRAAVAPVDRVRSERFPSWSWASVSAAVDYTLVRDGMSREETWTASLISLDAVPEGEAQSSATGSITLKGRVGRVFGLVDLPWGQLTGKEDSNYGLDLVVDGETPEWFWYLEIMTFGEAPFDAGSGMRWYPGRRPGAVLRLLLEPVDEGNVPRMFRRVGICRGNFEVRDEETKEVTLL